MKNPFTADGWFWLGYLAVLWGVGVTWWIYG